MAGTKVTDSPNIAVFDARIISDLCGGEFIVDTSPSTFIGSGASNVLGVKVKITNPYDVVIKPYTSSYDIAAPLTGVYTMDIPTQAGKPQYGTYQIELQITDANGDTHTVTKPVNVCTYNTDSHPCDERVRIIGDCRNGRVDVSIAEPPVFKGKYADSRTQNWNVYYPTASGVAPEENVTAGNFSLPLFQGVYKIQGSVCATYHMGDSVYLRLLYEADIEKNIKCLLDYTCIFPRLERLNEKIDAKCSERDKQSYTLQILDAIRLLTTAEMANAAGKDASKYIEELEKLLGCTCTCDCSGSPIVNGAPTTNMSIEGCGVTTNVVGLTTIYTINARQYVVTVDDTQDIITVSPVQEYGCVSIQQLNFNIANAYTSIKALVSGTTEYNFWAAAINNTLNNLDATCLGYSSEAWAALTFAQKINALIVGACTGGACTASIVSKSTARVGTDVQISFVQSGGYSADVYVDGVLKGNVILGVGEILVSGYADGANHSYLIVPKCSNGSNGTSANGVFAYLDCPSITPPTVTSNMVNDAVCPYDLTTLIYPEPPLGIEVEWHTLNNTSSGSLVPDPENVTSGVYYAFAKNADGCYSTATVVTLICAGATSCSAPQTLLVVDAVGGFKVSFQSAAFPPPSNSYTVKRKAAADPDVDGSYTTIGTPVWNSSTNRWEITDTTAVDNTLYTYKAQSNCSSSTPYVTYDFANIACPVITLTPSATEVGYSFPDLGGEISKYEVSVLDSSGAVVIATHTILPAFANPVTGTFAYLTEGVAYKIRLKIFIGTFSTQCELVPFSTDQADTITGDTYMNLSNPSMSSSLEVTTPGGRTLRFSNFSICGLSNASITISGGIGTINNVISSGSPNASQNVDTLIPPGSYTLTGTLSAGCTSSAGISFV